MQALMRCGGLFSVVSPLFYDAALAVVFTHSESENAKAKLKGYRRTITHDGLLELAARWESLSS